MKLLWSIVVVVIVNVGTKQKTCLPQNPLEISQSVRAMHFWNVSFGFQESLTRSTKQRVTNSRKLQNKIQHCSHTLRLLSESHLRISSQRIYRTDFYEHCISLRVRRGVWFGSLLTNNSMISQINEEFWWIFEWKRAKSLRKRWKAKLFGILVRDTERKTAKGEGKEIIIC